MTGPGLCQCGCGGKTEVAVRTSRRDGDVKGEPRRFIRGHHRRKRPLNPTGLCECGCGQPVIRPDARFVNGHATRKTTAEGPNPGGLCMCGCGEATPIARKSDRHNGQIIGQPVRYARGHQTRSSPVEYIVNWHGCWVWQRGVSPAGYGYARNQPAHRVVYEREHAPIPEGHHLHHRCVLDGYGTTRCVNPEHLEPLTPGEHKRIHRAAA